MAMNQNERDLVLTTIEGARKALIEAKGVYERNRAGEIPNAFLDVHQTLPLAEYTLQRVETFVSEYHDCLTGQDLRSPVGICQRTANNMLVLFRDVLSSHDSQRPETYRRSARGQGDVRQHRIKFQMRTLLVNIMKMIQIVDNCPAFDAQGQRAVAMDRNRVDELTETIRRLSDIPSSLTEDNSGHSFSHYGTGNVIANSGGGPQNNNVGDGSQYNADTQNFNGGSG
ncbi:hypothetical protein DM02DRAFT_709309 [Periconia macrospinosa]|uniref:NACHT-NTPase and P-loop NTPases N-terminal domain-containing protein n=1 Tax=Periconia macrospinosa TaxID=97972 RepID=A0A2V1E927_9PLEO|nr:hypothetical protein DM02DRAFT_709309 [Periconia macrospinosa]